jgi:polysaccharide pyruvyl transferase WcaK-like protein
VRPARIGLLWHSLRSNNLGVGALTLAQMHIVDSAAKAADRSVEYKVIGFGGDSPPITTTQAAISETIVNSRSIRPGSQLWREVRGCDLVLDIGGGDSWSDIYGAKRFGWMWALKQVCFLTGRPLIMSPQTVGPFKGRTAARLATQAMSRCRRVFTRDRQSLTLVRELGVTAPAEETVDVAFRLPFDRPEPRANGKIRVGFNVSGLLYAGGYTGRNQFGLVDDYSELADGIIEGLLARDDVEPILVPHVLSPEGHEAASSDHKVDDDWTISQSLVRRYPGLQCAPRFKTAIEAKSYIAGLDLLAGSRMHATIAAVSSGVAVVPLAYSRKFRGVFSSIGYDLVGDCTKQSARELTELTLGAVDRRDDLKAAAERSRSVATSKLAAYQEYLTGELRKLPLA